MSHYTYVLYSKHDHGFYTGYTDNLKKRLHQHKNGKVFATKHRLPMQLIYYEVCLSEWDGRAREKYLKSGMGKRYLRNRLKSYLNGL